MTRKKLKLTDLPAQCDPVVPSLNEVWPDVQPGGRESDAVVSRPADIPLEKLRGSVLRYDNPTDPVWPVDTEPD